MVASIPELASRSHPSHSNILILCTSRQSQSSRLCGQRVRRVGLVEGSGEMNSSGKIHCQTSNLSGVLGWLFLGSPGIAQQAMWGLFPSKCQSPEVETSNGHRENSKVLNSRPTMFLLTFILLRGSLGGNLDESSRLLYERTKSAI